MILTGLTIINPVKYGMSALVRSGIDNGYMGFNGMVTMVVKVAFRLYITYYRML